MRGRHSFFFVCLLMAETLISSGESLPAGGHR